MPLKNQWLQPYTSKCADISDPHLSLDTHSLLHTAAPLSLHTHWYQYQCRAYVPTHTLKPMPLKNQWLQPYTSKCADILDPHFLPWTHIAPCTQTRLCPHKHCRSRGIRALVWEAHAHLQIYMHICRPTSYIYGIWCMSVRPVFADFLADFFADIIADIHAHM